jgi:hypothetical protein
MMFTCAVQCKTRRNFTAAQMRPGDIAVATSIGSHYGVPGLNSIVVRTEDGLLDLTYQCRLRKSNLQDVEVSLLQPGEVVTLTVFDSRESPAGAAP